MIFITAERRKYRELSAEFGGKDDLMLYALEYPLDDTTRRNVMSL
jgi:hypothetical protein